MKSSFFRQFILFFLLIISAFVTVSAKSDWLKLKTTNFNLTGKISETELQKTANKLEKFHQFIQQHFSATDLKTPFQTNIIVVKDESDLNFSQPKNLPSFLTANDTNYAIISLNNSEFFEEFEAGYAKFLLENNVGKNNLPAWLFEGLVEHFESGAVEKNVKILQQNNLISTDNLFETDHFSLQNQDFERKQIFRAESWGMLQYLSQGEKKLAKVERFIELKKQGIESRNAVVEAFQTSLSKIKTEFPKFVEANNFAKQGIETVENISPENSWETSQTSESEWFAVQSDFLFYGNRLKEAEVLIEKSLKLEPNQSLALTTLALIKAIGFDYDEAEKFAEKAIEIEPNNFHNHFRYAVALSRRGMTEYGFVSGYNSVLANQMRASLKRAIALNPRFTASYALLAFVNFVRNEEINESIELIGQALKIAPGNQQFQLRLAELNLRKEKFSEARKLALQILQNTENAGVKLYAQNTIQRIDATEYQLERIRDEKTKYVNNEIVTDKPLTEEEIKRLREKATIEQIRAVLRRPNIGEQRVFGNLTKIECSKNRVEFLFKTQVGWQRFYSNSIDGVQLLSLVEEMSDYRLNCGSAVRANNASIIYKNIGEIVSIEFVPKGFK